MLNFKRIELSDKKYIDSCLEANTYRACDYCFTNLYAWSNRFKTVYAIKNNTLFIRFEDDDAHKFYMMPIGTMPLVSAFEEILEDAKLNKISLQMKGVTTRMWADIDSQMPGKFEYHHDDDNDEYIYLSESLIHLKGKKLQSKRNHINRFKSENPSWTYYPLTTPHDLQECADMLEQWGASKSDSTLEYDRVATKMMLENFDLLNLKGGAIKINGKIIAFTIGEKLTNDTFVVHVEKAFSEITGAYTIINQQFVECEAADYKYINREEDMGIEALRKAKLSYQPEIILQEGIVKLKH